MVPKALSHAQSSAPTRGYYHLWSHERHSHWLASADHGQGRLEEGQGPLGTVRRLGSPPCWSGGLLC